MDTHHLHTLPAKADLVVDVEPGPDAALSETIEAIDAVDLRLAELQRLLRAARAAHHTRTGG